MEIKNKKLTFRFLKNKIDFEIFCFKMFDTFSDFEIFSKNSIIFQIIRVSYFFQTFQDFKDFIFLLAHNSEKS